LDSGLQFEKETRVVNRGYTLTMEPRMFYVYIPYRNQSNLPLFDTTFADLNMATLFTENQFAGFDRVNNANQVSLSLSSRMIDSSTGKERLSVSLGQRFYFTDQKVTLASGTESINQLSDFVATMNASLTNRWDMYGGWQFDTRGNTNRANFGARYMPEPGKVLNLSYRYIDSTLSRVINGSAVNQFNISGQWPITPEWYAVGRWNYSIENSKTIQAIGGLEYDAGCWQSRFVVQRLSTATTTANYALFYQLELGGMASIGTSPFRILTKNIPGYTPTSQFDNTRFDQYE
jgi:LPS-assembly protein